MKILAVALALSLAGCSAGGDPDFVASNRECRHAPNWDACINGYIARMEARRARDEVEAERSRRREEALDDAVAAGILIDYAARPRSCMNVGGIITCN